MTDYIYPPTHTHTHKHTLASPLNPIPEKRYTKNAGPAEIRSKLAGCGRTLRRPQAENRLAANLSKNLTHTRTLSRAHARRKLSPTLTPSQSFWIRRRRVASAFTRTGPSSAIPAGAGGRMADGGQSAYDTRPERSRAKNYQLYGTGGTHTQSRQQSRTSSQLCEGRKRRLKKTKLGFFGLS